MIGKWRIIYSRRHNTIYQAIKISISRDDQESLFYRRRDGKAKYFLMAAQSKNR